MRAPYQILLFPYIKEGNNIFYALFRREDRGVWQGIAGGGEDDEKPIDTVRREAFEEGGIPHDSNYIKLASMATMPVENICGFKWGKEIAVIPEFSFGVEVYDRNIKISQEHSEYKWFSFEEAIGKLKWDSNKNALWELNHRLAERGIGEILKNIILINKSIDSLP